MEITPLNEKLEVAKPTITYVVLPKISAPKANSNKVPAVAMLVNKSLKLDHYFLKIGVGIMLPWDSIFIIIPQSGKMTCSHFTCRTIQEKQRL